MQKKIIILFSLFCLSGCTVFRSQKQDEDLKSASISSQIKLTDVESQNLTNKSFYIQKAKVEIISAREKQSILASVKFINPDTFLISIRSGSGIEAARIYLNRDTILINDRINKILYYGSQRAALKKYGISNKIFPIVFGDMVMSESIKPEIVNCVNEYFLIDSYLGNYIIKYLIDCNKRKIKSLSLTDETEGKSAKFEYKEFLKISNKYIASKIIIHDYMKLDIVNIEISKIESTWKGQIEFIPGKNYELVEIK